MPTESGAPDRLEVIMMKRMRLRPWREC
jgi:hypothetical protein